jgi:pyrroline-5-carboxylate reductase
MNASNNGFPEATSDLTDFSGQLVLVGAGKMGGALLEGWLRGGLDPARIAVLEPRPSPQLSALAGGGRGRGVRLNPDPASVSDVTAIVIAVKPQVAAQVLPSLPPLIGPQSVVVSIMAGRTLQFLATTVQRKSAIVRAMPNLPAAIGRGITVAVPFNVSTAQRELAQNLLAAIGTVEWIEDEALMDAVTALSGSGPAYVFLLAEALTRTGIAAGLPPSLAAKLARQTIAGSGELLDRSERDAAALRQSVTSPGGTTEAALEVLMAPDGLAPLINKAVAAAIRRSRELGG